MNPDLRTFGGLARVQGDGTPAWNFGYRRDVAALDAWLLARRTRGIPATFDEGAVHLRGHWDGDSTVPLWQAALHVTGKNLPAQKQDRGTCTSRGSTGAGNLRRCLQLADRNQKDPNFQGLSHAVMYGLGKEIAHDLGPRNRSANGDGCYGAAMAEAMHQWGFVTNDLSHDSDTSDQLAIQYAIEGVPADLKTRAAEHQADTLQVTNINDAFDLLAAGNTIFVCSGQGFTLKRDADGFCQPQGTWAHCMYWAGILVVKTGAWGSPNGAGGATRRRGPVNAQSWGPMCPDGPLPTGLDMPDYSFGIDEATADRMLQMRDSFGIATVRGFGPVRLPWLF